MKKKILLISVAVLVLCLSLSACSPKTTLTGEMDPDGKSYSITADDTDEGDMVYDPFGGSCVTGEVAERLNRRWICSEIIEEYLSGAMGRFSGKEESHGAQQAQLPLIYNQEMEANYYRLPHPGILWDSACHDALPQDGGEKRAARA